MVTSDTFLERFTKFKGIPTDIIDLVISEAKIISPESIFNDCPENYDTALSYLVAHILTVERRDQLEEGLVLKNLKEREYDVYERLLDLDKDLDYYKLSVYGRLYLKLRDSVVGVSFFVV